MDREGKVNKNPMGGVGRRVEIPIETPNGKKHVHGTLLAWGNDEVGTVAIVEVDGGKVTTVFPRDAVFKSGECFNLISHLHRQRAFSFVTFGPGARTAGVLDHIRKELAEIEASPLDLTEWVDVILLALDGAWRAGHHPREITAAIEAKQTKNEARKWPDWRTAEPGKAIEHVKGETA